MVLRVRSLTQRNDSSPRVDNRGDVSYSEDMSNTPTPIEQPDTMAEAWFVINVETEEILHGATTKRKANNLRKKAINFGNPIPGHHNICVSWDPATAFYANRMRNDIYRNGFNASPEAKAWANADARRAAGTR